MGNILYYKHVKNADEAKHAVRAFEKRFHCDYNWGQSCGEIEEARMVFLYQYSDGHKGVITSNKNEYNLRYATCLDNSIGEL